MSRRLCGIRWRRSSTQLSRSIHRGKRKTRTAVEQTHFGRCFAEIIDWLESAQGSFLLWCHLGGLGTTWDAPLRFRQAYCEQGDPPPPEAADVPERMLPPQYDPDELLGVMQSYCGQVTLLDTCLGAVLGFLLWAADQRRDAVDGHFGSRISTGRTRPGGAVRRRCLARRCRSPGCCSCPTPLAPPCAARRWSSRPTCGRVCWNGGASATYLTRPLPKASCGWCGRRLASKGTSDFRRPRLRRGARENWDSPPRSALRGWQPRSAGDPHSRLVSPRWTRSRAVRQAGRPLGDQQRRLPLSGGGRKILQDAVTQYELALPEGRIAELLRLARCCSPGWNNAARRRRAAVSDDPTPPSSPPLTRPLAPRQPIS